MVTGRARPKTALHTACPAYATLLSLFPLTLSHPPAAARPPGPAHDGGSAPGVIAGPPPAAGQAVGRALPPAAARAGGGVLGGRPHAPPRGELRLPARLPPTAAGEAQRRSEEARGPHARTHAHACAQTHGSCLQRRATYPDSWAVQCLLTSAHAYTRRCIFSVACGARFSLLRPTACPAGR